MRERDCREEPESLPAALLLESWGGRVARLPGPDGEAFALLHPGHGVALVVPRGAPPGAHAARLRRRLAEARPALVSDGRVLPVVSLSPSAADLWRLTTVLDALFAAAPPLSQPDENWIGVVTAVLAEEPPAPPPALPAAPVPVTLVPVAVGTAPVPLLPAARTAGDLSPAAVRALGGTRILALAAAGLLLAGGGAAALRLLAPPAGRGDRVSVEAARAPDVLAEGPEAVAGTEELARVRSQSAAGPDLSAFRIAAVGSAPALLLTRAELADLVAPAGSDPLPEEALPEAVLGWPAPSPTMSPVAPAPLAEEPLPEEPPPASRVAEPLPEEPVPEVERAGPPTLPEPVSASMPVAEEPVPEVVLAWPPAAPDAAASMPVIEEPVPEAVLAWPPPAAPEEPVPETARSRPPAAPELAASAPLSEEPVPEVVLAWPPPAEPEAVAAPQPLAEEPVPEAVLAWPPAAAPEEPPLAGGRPAEPAPRAAVAPPLAAPAPPPVPAGRSVGPGAPAPPPADGAPAGLATPPPAVPALPPALLEALLRRGDQMLALGDVSAARLLYERAAAAGHGPAATALGRTFDPAVLASLRVRGVRPDPAAAAGWYRRARDLGDDRADALLRRLPGP